MTSLGLAALRVPTTATGPVLAIVGLLTVNVAEVGLGVQIVVHVDAVEIDQTLAIIGLLVTGVTQAEAEAGAQTVMHVIDVLHPVTVEGTRTSQTIMTSDSSIRTLKDLRNP